MQPVFWKTRSPTVAGMDRLYRLYSKANVRLRVDEKAIFQSDCCPIHAMVTLLCRTIKSTLEYNSVISRTWVTAEGSNTLFKMAAKQLQISMVIVDSSYRKSPLPYLTVSSPTSYDIPFSHNACVADKQTTEWRHIVPNALSDGKTQTTA